MDQQLIIPFGQYKGRNITEVMATEPTFPQYIEWVKQQNGVATKYPTFYNFIVHQVIPVGNSNINSRTPAHNQLQNYFLNKENQKNLLLQFYGKQYQAWNTSLSNLCQNSDIIRMFNLDRRTFEKLTPSLDSSTIQFEGKYNWDIILNYYYDNQWDFQVRSDQELELANKLNWRVEYDIEQQLIYDEKISLFDKRISIRQHIDQEIQNHKMNIGHQFYQTSRFQFHTELTYYYNENSGVLSSNICNDQLETYLSTFKYSSKEMGITNNSNKERKIIDTVADLIKQKQQFEIEYSNKYDENFQSNYNEYRINYYKQIIEQYFNSKRKNSGVCVDVFVVDQNQFQILIAFEPPSLDIDCEAFLNIYCEIKPILGDDYPCVLRKMNTQISATEMKMDLRDKEYNRYVLLVDKFESSVTTDEQLIEIFKQSNIRVIFANQIIPEIQLNQRDNVSALVT